MLVLLVRVICRVPGFTCLPVWGWSSASPFGETRCFPVEGASSSSPRAVRFFIGTPDPAELDKLPAPAEVKLTRKCEQDNISTGVVPHLRSHPALAESSRTRARRWMNFSSPPSLGVLESRDFQYLNKSAPAPVSTRNTTSRRKDGQWRNPKFRSRPGDNTLTP